MFWRPKFLAYAGSQQFSPTQTLFQPLCDHGVSFNVNAYLIRRKPRPGGWIASIVRVRYRQRSDFDPIVDHSVLFRRRTVMRFNSETFDFRHKVSPPEKILALACGVGN